MNTARQLPFLTFLGILGLFSPLRAQVVTGPWQEAVISVSDLDRTAAFFLEVGGYEVRWRGEADIRQLRYWNLETATGAKAMVLAPPWAKDGFIRLIQLEGVEQVPTRPGARPWDTGCYFSLMLRGKGLDDRYREAIRLGWWTESEIIDIDFGESQLKNVVFKGPDGVGISVYERLAPPLPEYWPQFDRLTQPFNNMQMVRNRDATHDFFEEVLGFETWYKSDPSAQQVPTYSNFSVPTHLSTSSRTRAGILYPVAGEVGRMEFIEFMDIPGRDYSDRCLPPNLGIVSIRYPVRNLDSALEQVTSKNVNTTYAPGTMTLKPYGEARLFGIQSPDGALLELMETTK